VGAWPEFVTAMRLVLPGHGDVKESRHDPTRWVILPALCCQAAGGKIESSLEISAAWFLLYTAAHVVDTIEDGDLDPKISELGGPGVAINIANGLFLSAIMQLQSMNEDIIPKELAAEITTDYLETILIMTSGQHLDLTHSRIKLNQWWQIAESKSGAFFSLACRAGAYSGASDHLKVNGYSKYGFHLGLMLQIIDDLEDFQYLSKPIENSIPNTIKNSLAVAYAYDVLPATIRDELTQLLVYESFRQLQRDTLIDILEDCGAGLYILAELEKHYELSLSSLLEVRPLSPAKGELEALIHSLKVNSVP